MHSLPITPSFKKASKHAIKIAGRIAFLLLPQIFLVHFGFYKPFAGYLLGQPQTNPDPIQLYNAEYDSMRDSIRILVLLAFIPSTFWGYKFAFSKNESTRKALRIFQAILIQYGIPNGVNFCCIFAYNNADLFGIGGCKGL